MVAKVIDGNKLAAEIKERIKKEVLALETPPGLAVILVGEDPASTTYVRMKEKDCHEVGIQSFVKRLPEDTPEKELLKLIRQLNKNEHVHGILVQLPLPKHISEKKVMATILPEKDVDGFHAINAGKLFSGDPTGLVACTPKGVIELIKSTGVEMKGKNAVVIGRSNIVGKPVSILLLNEHCTVTICHSRTQDLPGVIRQADIVVAAIGKAKMITADMIKEEAIVIDVGINRVEGKLVGDVDYEEVAKKASFITPVPGGVGPMTRALLLQNTLDAQKKQVQA
ncbi:MAG: bifunctional methylenetetrahydrofolate dehydrogenase/methenyltetrahydrofolate cyclohydrolase FolD [Candidatus Margulisbacteria bacterium]|nr:bifunctional methylenetetrahydrofolate dehydrogenase/methenyltetrahydrofolate cyclohydrolase FolD [Candidatus Margulisiibacteriota bacterium]